MVPFLKLHFRNLWKTLLLEQAFNSHITGGYLAMIPLNCGACPLFAKHLHLQPLKFKYIFYHTTKVDFRTERGNI